LIDADALTVRYRRGGRRRTLVALDGVSFRVRRGDVFGLLGPNGAGKSTALRCVLGLIRPDEGRVAVLGERPLPGAGLFRRVGYVPEEPHYHLYLTVEEAVTFYTGLQGRPPAPAEVAAALDRVGLAEFRDLRLSKCSKGMKQKTGLAAALLHRPELLVLDEPTRGLDPIVVKQLRDLLRELSGQGVTILLSSHVLPEVEAVCNRVAILRAGRLLLEDEVSALRRAEIDRYRVEIRAPDPQALPPIVQVETHRDGLVRGVVARDDLPRLFELAAGSGWEVLHCNVVERSLEDSFFAALEGET